MSGIPPHLSWDEASIGYNALSLVETGKDETGSPYPMFFQAFGEEKLPVTIYLTALSIKIFGVSEFAVRFPSAVFGALAIIGVYFLARVVFEKENLAIAASLFLALSPWHLQFSRGAFEANIALTFFIFGLALLWSGKKHISFFPFFIASLLWGLAIYTYNGFFVFLPLFLLFSSLFFLRQQKRLKLYFLLFALLFFIFALPFFVKTVKERGGQRFAQVGIVKRVVWEKEKDNFPSFLQHRAVIIPTLFVKNYISHFSPDFLLFQGDKNQRHSISSFGVLYVWELLLAIAGLFLLFRYRKELFFFVLGWILLFPVAASLTKESPHALRTLMFLPLPQLLAAFGIVRLKEQIRWRKLHSFILAGVIAGFFVLYLYSYYVVYPIQSSKHWQYGYKEIVMIADKQKNQVKKIIVTNEYAQPYIFFLFYLQYNPSRFQSEVQYEKIADWGVSKVSSFDKFEFRKIEYEREKNRENVLLIGTPEEIPKEVIAHNVYFLNGEVAFRVVKL